VISRKRTQMVTEYKKNLLKSQNPRENNINKLEKMRRKDERSKTQKMHLFSTARALNII
jgi:hypothetical protein